MLLLPLFCVLLVLQIPTTESQLCPDEDTALLTDSDLFYLQVEQIAPDQFPSPSPSPSPSRNDSSESDDDSCPVNMDGPCNPRDDIHCMCGCDLEASQSRRMRRLNSTCDNYGTIEDKSSLISFCKSSLSTRDFRGRRSDARAYCVRFVNASQEASNSDVPLEMFTKKSLADVVKKMEESLHKFSKVLNRTIVGVYFRSPGQRCACLEAYKKWLCTTMLPLYEQLPANESVDQPSSCCNNTVSTTDNGTIIRKRPCLDVCHSVLQICPYYLPSRFQTLENQPGDLTEVIYGGYPAFDCPREKTITKQSCGNRTYTPPGEECDCLRFMSSRSSRHSLSLPLMFVGLIATLTVVVTGLW